MHRVIYISSVLGVFAVVQTFGLLLIGWEWLNPQLAWVDKVLGWVHVENFDKPHLQTMLFLQLVAGGHLMLFVTRSTRIMATMVNTGVKLLDAIRVAQGSVDNYYFQQLWGDVYKRIEDGYQLSESIMLAESSDLISPGIIQMLRAGEKSGRLGEVCDKVSVFYEKKLQASIQNVMTLIEPLMITVLGIVIGTIAIGLLLPVFRVSSVIAH